MKEKCIKENCFSVRRHSQFSPGPTLHGYLFGFSLTAGAVRCPAAYVAAPFSLS